jgi:phosphonate transport system substrate-binding protein
VIKKSIQFGNPLMVAAASVPIPEKNSIRDVLLTMHEDVEGKKILEELLIDRFVKPQDQWYQSIRMMKEKCAGP